MSKLDRIIEKAKGKVIKAYGRSAKGRRWLRAYVDPYGDPSNRVEVLVLEGSPAKGIVIVNYGRGYVTCLDAWGNKLYTWYTWKVSK